MCVEIYVNRQQYKLSLTTISYNQKSDIWALGCVLYELASLKRAFEAAVSCLPFHSFCVCVCVCVCVYMCVCVCV